MTFLELSQIVTAVAALAAVVASWHNGRKIQEIHLSINSRMDELLRVTGAEQRAVGAKEERDKSI